MTEGVSSRRGLTGFIVTLACCVPSFLVPLDMLVATAIELLGGNSNGFERQFESLTYAALWGWIPLAVGGVIGMLNLRLSEPAIWIRRATIALLITSLVAQAYALKTVFLVFRH